MGNLPDWPDTAAFAAWLSEQRNDLEDVAVELVPQVGDVLSALSDSMVARMTGSGTSCYGLYPDRDSARRAAADISKARPGWWARDTITIGAGFS